MRRTDQDPTPRPGRTDITALADQAVVDLARTLADRAFGAPSTEAPSDPDDPRSAPRAPEFTGSLARLHALSLLHEAVERCAGREAQAAADAGAGYPQLGSAWGISRQGARRRWPGLALTSTRPPVPPLRPRSGEPT